MFNLKGNDSPELPRLGQTVPPGAELESMALRRVQALQKNENVAHMCIYVKYMYVFVTKRKFLLLRQVSFGATPKLGISTSTSTAENLFVDPKGFEVGSPSFPTQLMRVALTTVPHSRTFRGASPSKPPIIPTRHGIRFPTTTLELRVLYWCRSR